MSERCETCGRRLDRPTWDGDCKAPHPGPRLADVIVHAVESECDDRRGLRWGCLDDETLDEVRDAMRDRIQDVLEDYLR